MKAWCGNPDHDDPCDDCDTTLVDAADELRRRMPTGEPFVEVLQEPATNVCAYCSEAIEAINDGWRHVNGTKGHAASPANLTAPR